ncbi:hypothetical protein E4U55_002720 [Claviceps digitariae]|nr:hypothetical protein E4U55_002720 [Claviceps digitariae]
MTEMGPKLVRVMAGFVRMVPEASRIISSGPFHLKLMSSTAKAVPDGGRGGQEDECEVSGHFGALSRPHSSSILKEL